MLRAPRLALLVSAAALLTAAGAQAQTATPYQPAGQTTPTQAAPADPNDPSTFTDEELRKYDAAITRVRAVSDTLNGAQPTPEQQAEMAAAVQESGLEVVRFNAISRAAADNPVIDARIRAMKAPPPVPGSVAAGVSAAVDTPSSISSAAARRQDTPPGCAARRRCSPSSATQSLR